MACLARLTDFETTKSKEEACHVKLCKNIPEKGELLCQGCLLRPETGKRQTSIIHGTLLEPPCADSHIYGSIWYWEHESHDTEWIQAAQEAQAAAEELCERAGYSPWRVQRPSAWRLEEMKKKAAAKAKESTALTQVRLSQVTEKKGTLLEKFAPIKVVYEESDKAPEKLPTDTCKIWRDTVGDMNVWITESGLVFDEDTTGQPGELIGRRVKGTASEFIGLDES